MERLAGKVALVTGGGSGIGLAITEAFVRDGGRVVVTGRRRDPLDAVESRFPGRIAAVSADVRARGDSARALAITLERFGNLDILVNNAGIFSRAPLGETEDDAIAEMLDVNFRGVLSWSRDALPHLAARKGCIVNVSSAASLYARPGLAAYGGSKAALNHATRILAAELGPMGVRVNAVAPGLTRTEMTAPILEDPARLDRMLSQTALGRIGEPEDIAKVVVFLASDDAAWVTGQTIAASGGLFL